MPQLDIFTDPRTVQDFTANFGHSQHAFKYTVNKAIQLAMSTGANKATASTVGQSGPDVRYVLTTLNSMGYTAAILGTTLTVSW